MDQGRTQQLMGISDAAAAMRPGQPERIEYEYKRHGTLCLIGNWNVVTGQMIAPTIGTTRTEEDFVWHIFRNRGWGHDEAVSKGALSCQNVAANDRPPPTVQTDASETAPFAKCTANVAKIKKGRVT